MKIEMENIKKIIEADDDKRDHILYKCYHCDCIFPIFQFLSDHIEFIAPFCAVSTYPIYTNHCKSLLP